VTSGEISDRARAFGLPVEVVDGNDVLAVHQAAKDAVTRARAGQGPSYIEGKTYRIHGHIEAEVYFLASAYRDDKEVAKWLEKDPIDRLRADLLDGGEADEAALGAIECSPR
jgi:pyruvate dehydrogenase E1 component alpha subunit